MQDKKLFWVVSLMKRVDKRLDQGRAKLSKRDYNARKQN